MGGLGVEQWYLSILPSPDFCPAITSLSPFREPHFPISGLSQTQPKSFPEISYLDTER